MHISAYSLDLLLDVLVFEFQSRLIGFGYDKEVETQGENGDERGGEYIRQHHPMEADSAGEDGDNLRVGSHFRCEENHRNEHEQRTEHIHEVRYKVDVIVEYDSPQWRFLAHELIDLLTDVEDDDDADDQKQRHKERRYEFLDDINVQFPWSEVKLHLLKVLWLSCARSHPSTP